MAEANDSFNDKDRVVQPVVTAVAITGSAQTLAVPGRCLIITTTGNIVFTTIGGSSITWNSIPVGIHPITVRTITTGATAAGYVGIL